MGGGSGPPKQNMASRTWVYLEQPPIDGDETIKVSITDEDILDTYWDYWVGEMLRVHKLPMITPQSCIEDFVVVNWAWEVKDEA